MKKMLIFEIVILTVLVVGAFMLCLDPGREVMAPDVPETTDQTTTALEETTEPEATWMTFPEDRALTCQQYFVYDLNANTFVQGSHGENERVYPASITKLFTAYVALEYLQPAEKILAGGELDLVVWGSSVAGIQSGDVLSAEKLVEAMLLPSGNDAAYVMAAAAGRVILDSPEADARYAVEAFMEKMNARAKELGLTESHFVNPDGIHDDEHYMSFHDLALLGKLAMGNETIMKYAALAQGDNPRYAPEDTGEDAQKQWKNTNELIHETSQYYCPWARGLKTGQTPMAGSCLLSAFQYEGEEYVIGVFGCPEKDDRFADTLQLFNKTIGK